MTLANDVKAKLAFQPGDAEALAMEIHELEDGLLAYNKIVSPVRLMSGKSIYMRAQAGIEAIWHDYLINGITEGMAVRALLTVTK
jgi:hypothetical protein